MSIALSAVRAMLRLQFDLVAKNAYVQVSQVVTEIVRPGESQARVSQVVVEVLSKR